METYFSFWIFLPAYNEEQALPKLLPKIDEVVRICKSELDKAEHNTQNIVKIACETVRKKIISNI